MTAIVTGGQPGRPVRQDEYVVEVAAHLGTPVTWGQLAAWPRSARTRRRQPRNEDRCGIWFGVRVSSGAPGLNWCYDR